MSGWTLDLRGIQAPELAVMHPSSPGTRELKANDQMHDMDFPDDHHVVRGNTSTFCTKENVLNSVGYINQEFQLLGLPCLKFDSTHRSFDLVFLINRIYDLLTLYHKTVAVKEELENRNRRLNCETEHLHSTSKRMKRLQGQSDRELDQEREKVRQLNHKYKQVSAKLKTEKEEVKRLTAVIQSRDLQQRHELKKKEREVHRLKERLHQLLSDKAPDRKVGIDMMNIVGRSEGRRATWKTGPEKQEEEMYQLLINNYEARHCEVTQENSELRDCLLNLQRELSTLLKRTGDMTGAATIEISSLDDDVLSSEDDGEEDSSPATRLSISDLSEGYFQMPYDMVRHEIEKTFRDTCNQISESMKRSLIKTGHPSITMSASVNSSKKEVKEKPAHDSAEVERLKRQINQYKTIMKQQEELLQQSLSHQSQPEEVSFLHESRLLKEKENLAEQKRLFFEEKANFEKERQAYTEAAIRLGKERQALHEEKASFLKQSFLNLSPFKESSNKKPREGQSNRLLPATPVFSPAKSTGKPESSSNMSASELYRALGLSSASSTHSRKDSRSRQLVKLTRSSSTDARLDNVGKQQENQDKSQSLTSTEAAANLETIRNSLLKLSTVQRATPSDEIESASEIHKP